MREKQLKRAAALTSNDSSRNEFEASPKKAVIEPKPDPTANVESTAERPIRQKFTPIVFDLNAKETKPRIVRTKTIELDSSSKVAVIRQTDTSEVVSSPKLDRAQSNFVEITSLTVSSKSDAIEPVAKVLSPVLRRPESTKHDDEVRLHTTNHVSEQSSAVATTESIVKEQASAEAHSDIAVDELRRKSMVTLKRRISVNQPSSDQPVEKRGLVSSTNRYLFRFFKSFII
jgi:hypothetical protein